MFYNFRMLIDDVGGFADVVFEVEERESNFRVVVGDGNSVTGPRACSSSILVREV